ncbi:hypothetical protein FRB94_013458 [Tulasnella sp. JGI-2019a]|nr:hypothetical protein FRB94_013458 [Tulasnella sp. JGI-2019a]
MVGTDNTGSRLRGKMLGPFVEKFRSAIGSDNPDDVQAAAKKAWEYATQYDHLSTRGYFLQQLPKNIQSNLAVIE